MADGLGQGAGRVVAHEEAARRMLRMRINSIMLRPHQFSWLDCWTVRALRKVPVAAAALPSSWTFGEVFRSPTDCSKRHNVAQSWQGSHPNREAGRKKQFNIRLELHKTFTETVSLRKVIGFPPIQTQPPTWSPP